MSKKHDSYALGGIAKHSSSEVDMCNVEKCCQQEKMDMEGTEYGLIARSKEKIGEVCFKNSDIISCLLKVLLHLVVFIYTICAINYWRTHTPQTLDFCDGLGLLMIILTTCYWCVFYYNFLKPQLAKYFTFFPKTIQLPPGRERYLKWFAYVTPAAAFLSFVVYDSYPNFKRLTPLAGIAAFILGGYIFSKHPNHIKWSIIYRGIMLQFIIALLTVRWTTGRAILWCIGEKVDQFLRYGYKGAAFVYGDEIVYKMTTIAFQSLSIMFFFGFLVEILFHYKILQRVFFTWGWALHKIVGTTAIESVNSCASVFLGMTEAPLLIRPYMKDLTLSELQSVMLGGLATVAGSIMAAYISFGVNASYLINASIMSAPAALSYSKLLYPETEVSKTKSENLKVDNTVSEGNVIAAACRGAVSCIYVVQSTIANLIAIISFVAFVNGLLSWLGLLVGVENFTLDVIFSKFFYPVALLIGVDFDQCEQVSKLIALKITINEFTAYRELGRLKQLGKLTPRSEFIATYALCSFANFGSVGCTMAILCSLCPEQKDNFSKLAIRALIGGTVTCFITASISALLIHDEFLESSL